MRRLSLLPVFLLLAVGAHAQESFHVVSVAPAAGPIAGGTEVVFQLDQTPFCFDPVPAASVSFGGVDAVEVRQDFGTNTIRAVTPAHAAGTVDVLVVSCGGPSATVVGGFTYLDTPTASYEKVLLPVLFEGPGGFGARWTTRARVMASSTERVQFARAAFEGDPACPSVCGCAAGSAIDPDRPASVCVAGFSDPAGLILYAPTSATLHYGLRIFDASRSTVDSGTEIPVVHERDFRFDRIVLLDLPWSSSAQRTALRIYNPDQRDGAQVRLTFTEPNGVDVITERVVTLQYLVRTLVFDPYPNRPAFAYFPDLIARFDDGTVPSQLPESYNLIITPVTRGLRIWAFASVTNNTTQQVTVVSPQ